MGQILDLLREGEELSKRIDEIRAELRQLSKDCHFAVDLENWRITSSPPP